MYNNKKLTAFKKIYKKDIGAYLNTIYFDGEILVSLVKLNILCHCFIIIFELGLK